MRIVLHPILVLLLVALLQTTARGIPSVKRGRSFQHNRVAPIATIDAKAYPSSSDAYPLDYDKENRETEKVTNDLVVFYTRNSKRRIVVAVAAALAMVIFVHILSTFLVSASSIWVLWASAMFALVFTFLKGDTGDFCRSLGVCILLLSQRTSWATFSLRFVRQLKGMLRLSSRRPFPPCSNPWQYFPAQGQPDLQFGMMGALAGTVLSAAYIGWLVGRAVPLLPNWVGALSAACVSGYLTTLQDGRGDMLRFLGYSLSRCLAVLSATLDDVQLRDRTATLLGHVLFFSKSVDSKYKMVERLQFLLAELIGRLSMLIARLRSDMSGAPVRPRPGPRLENTERYGNYPPYPGDYADKRYSSSSSSSSPEYSYGTNRRRRETDDFGVSDERSEKKSVWWT